jgi:hypothetical protein
MPNRTSLRSLLTATALALAGLAALAGPAAANDLFTLDANATGPGRVVTDAAGTAYIAWNRKGATFDVPMFCRIPAGGTCTSPVTLSIPGATGIGDETSGVFPVLGGGSTVYVVGPRYVHDDSVVWTSTDGGASFNGGVVNPDSYPAKSDPSDVLLSDGEFQIVGFNSGLGFGTSPTAGGAGTHLEFADPGPGGVAGGRMELDPSGNPLIAYWNLSSPAYQVLFYRYKGTGPKSVEANWEGPIPVGNGYETRLAGGPAGLFLVDQEYAGSSYPTSLVIRKFSGTTFGPPLTIAADAGSELFNGGAAAQSFSGTHLDVAWPGKRSDGTRVMKLYSSSNGGASFVSSEIAHIGNAYAILENAQLAVADNGGGWLTYLQEGGLKVADLNPIAAPVVPTPKPPNYKGKEKTIAKKAGAFDFTLRLPQGCVQSQQSFFTGVGKRKRKGLSKSLGGKVKFKQVVFIYDGKKLKVKKKKPFRYLIDPGPMAPGSVHVVKTKVTAILTKKGKEKKIKRTLQGTIKAC